jgi:uncharacterized protein (TIGR02599 family)
MPSFSKPSRRAFTLPEVLIAIAILLVIMVAMLEFCTDVEQTWKSDAADPFAEARDAFESVVKNLSAATLEPYQDYADATGAFRTNATTTFTPDHLARRSDLDFVCGPGSGTTGLLTAGKRTTAGSAAFFLAPQGETQTSTYEHHGLERMLNAIGYFVEFGTDDTMPAFILPQTQTWRWRLKQVLQPTESLQIFATASSADWIAQLVPAGTSVPVLAENVIALIVLPESAAGDSTLAPAFSYDSRNSGNKLTLHQLPPCLRVALVAIDAPSAQLLAAANGANPPPLISTSLFQQAAQLNADLATLDAGLTAQKIGHRFFQREILLSSAAWSNTASQ